MVNGKVKAALRHDRTPILCIGETADQRNKGKTFEVIRTQLIKCLADINPEHIKGVVIAYEPVWAIAQPGKPLVAAKPDDIRDAHFFIRGELDKIGGKGIGNAVTVLYGGSVTPENVASISALEDVNGALPGTKSLDAKAFFDIIKAFD
jgi:triosephosphate isomerase